MWRYKWQFRLSLEVGSLYFFTFYMPQKNPNRTTFSASKSIQKKEHKQTQNQDQNTSFPDCLAEVLITSCNLVVRPAACSCILLFRRYLLQPVCLYTQDGPEYAMRANTGGHVSMVTHQTEVRMEAEVSGDIPLEIEKGAARITRSLPSSPPCYGSACVAMCLCVCVCVFEYLSACVCVYEYIFVHLRAVKGTSLRKGSEWTWNVLCCRRLSLISWQLRSLSLLSNTLHFQPSIILNWLLATMAASQEISQIPKLIKG